MVINKLKRYISHLYKSGCLTVGLEHFLVMFPSAMLIARLMNSSMGAVIELPTILLACGLGTLLFALLTKGRIPFFLGPSFCYIGFVSYQVANITAPNDVGLVRSTIFYGYLIAGVLLLILSLVYRFDKIKRVINVIFPSTIMGPAISLIGLELANMAAQDAGLTGDIGPVKMIAIITLVLIIVFSLLRHHFLQNASILIGVILGSVVALWMGYMNLPVFQGVSLSIPEFYFSWLLQPPKQIFSLILAVAPCALIAFVESLGRLTVYEGMLKRDEMMYDCRLSNKAIFMHSLTSVFTSVTNMMPSAIYAENLAIMNLHRAEISTKHSPTEDDDIFIKNCYSPYSIYPYCIAAAFSVIVALVDGLQELFLAIPMSVLGGMELFVFALISAPGIQMLVDQQINYKKISNQIITASVFLAGVSNISITYGSLILKGMSLGLAIGVTVNIITLILRKFGWLNEKFAVNEVLDVCIDVFSDIVRFSVYDKEDVSILIQEISCNEFKTHIRRKDVNKQLTNASRIEVQDTSGKRTITLLQDQGNLKLKVALQPKYRNRFINDHHHIPVEKGNKTTIVLNEYVSIGLLSEILKNIQ